MVQGKHTHSQASRIQSLNLKVTSQQNLRIIEFAGVIVCTSHFLKRFFFNGRLYNLMERYNYVNMTSVLFYLWQALFREELLPQFLTVLLHSLVHKSHALLGEEIAVALYNMAAVNFLAFHDAFLPQFLHSTDGLDDGQRSILQRNFKTDTVS
jgi:hypothetical protein